MIANKDNININNNYKNSNKNINSNNNKKNHQEGKCAEIVENTTADKKNKPDVLSDESLALCDKDDKCTSMGEMSNGVRTDDKEADQQFFQSSNIVEEDAEHEDGSQENFLIPIERNRKLTRAPIFKEIVKKVIAENMIIRMMRETHEEDSNNSKHMQRATSAEPDIADQDDTKPCLKDNIDNHNESIDDHFDLIQPDNASSHGDSPRYNEDENKVSKDDNGDSHSDPDNMTAIVAGYELKINYLEEELKKKKIVYEQKLNSLIGRVNSVEKRIGEGHQKKTTPAHQLTSEVSVLRNALAEQLSLFNGKIDQINEKMQTLNQRRDQLFKKAEVDLENLKHATEDKLSEVNENLMGQVDNTLERSENNAKLLNGMKCELAGTNNDIDGRIREILSVVTEQRRKYQSKFLEVETEAARVKIMVNATKSLLENVQNSLEEIEGGKRNNLIFHGVVIEHPETQIRC